MQLWLHSWTGWYLLHCSNRGGSWFWPPVVGQELTAVVMAFTLINFQWERGGGKEGKVEERERGVERERERNQNHVESRTHKTNKDIGFKGPCPGSLYLLPHTKCHPREALTVRMPPASWGCYVGPSQSSWKGWCCRIVS